MNARHLTLASCALFAVSLCVGAVETDGDALQTSHLEVAGCSVQSGMGKWTACTFKSTRHQPISLADLDAVCHRETVAARIGADSRLPATPEIGLVCKGDDLTIVSNDLQ